MRRVVYATKSEDLRKEMADYDARTTELQTRYNEQSAQYKKRILDESAALEKEVRDAIGPSSIQDIQIRADRSWNFDGKRDDGKDSWQVWIKVNDNSKWDDKTSLSWHYDINVDNSGNVNKETGSWSGLKATTLEQLDDLKESVRLMEIIGNIDWASLLQRAAINYDDYIDSDNATALHERQKTRPDYENQIAAAEVEEYIGQNIWVKLSGSPSSQWGNARGEYYAKIDRATPSRYVIDLVPAKYVGTEGVNLYKMTDVTVSKANFLAKLEKPVETYTEG